MSRMNGKKIHNIRRMSRLTRDETAEPVSRAVELTHLVVKWSAVKNQSEIETSLKMRGMSPFLFVKLVKQRRTQNHAKPAHRVRRSSGQPFTGTTRSAGVGGGWVSVSDIGRVGKKMVLRRILIYFLSIIFHDLKPNKLASSRDQIPRRERGQGNIHFSPFSHEQDWHSLTRLIHISCYGICDDN